MSKRVMLGTDPELFVRNVDTKEHVPAWYVLGGDVDLALPFGTAVCDGMAVEFTVDPCDQPDLMVSRIGHNLLKIRQTVENSGMQHVVSVAPNVFVEKKHIDALGQSHGRGSLQQFGCNPDDRVYSLPHIQRPEPKGYPYRSSGGHIHLEVGELATWKPGYSFMIAMLDQVVGTTTTFISDSQEARERKKLYGKSGYYRTNPKLGTVEYRTPTAQSLVQNADLCSTMFTAAQAIGQFAVDLLETEGPDGYISRMQELLGDNDQRNAVALRIDHHDIAGCRSHLRKLSKKLPPELSIVAMEMVAMGSLTTFNIDWRSYEYYLDVATKPGAKSRQE